MRIFNKNIVLCSIFLAFFVIDLSFAQTSKIDSLLKLLTKVKDTTEVNVLNELSEEFALIPDSMSLVYGKRALDIAERIKYKKGKGIANFNLGMYYSNVFDYFLAIEFYSKALKISNEAEDKKTVANTLNNIGVVYDYQGNYPKALEYYTKALQLREKLGYKRDVAVSFNNIGIFYYNQSNYNSALDYYFRSLKIYEELNDKNGELNPILNIGVTFFEQENYLKALEYLAKALKLSEELNDASGISFALSNIGSVYFEQGDYKRALEYFNKAQIINKQLEDVVGIAIVLNNIADCYFRLGQVANALKFSLQSFDLAKEIDLKDDMKEAATLLSNIYFSRKNYKKALDYFKLASALNDTIFNDDKSKEIGRVEARYEIEKKIEEEKRAEEERLAREESERTRKSNLQYLIIMSLVLAVFISFFFLRKMTLNPRLLEGFIFLSFLLFFEFINVLLDPIIQQYTGGFPLPKLIISAILAACLTFLDKLFEDKFKKRIIANKVQS